ncbi:Poly [ADP-ribose] polymerase 1 [Ancistrocladus abbreviatus]
MLARMMVSTPPPQPEKRCCMSPIDTSAMPNKLLRRPTRISLNFDDPENDDTIEDWPYQLEGSSVDFLLPERPLQSVREKEQRIKEEQDSAISQAKRWHMLPVKMLEALQDIEIASRLVGFDVDNEDSLDEGEFDKFALYREKLGNRMLLWRGSRLTNFVGIFSQRLRIAPPVAPATGYMGINSTDLVSKNAQYCYTDRKNPVGLMLQSEVALGEIYELKMAKLSIFVKI